MATVTRRVTVEPLEWLKTIRLTKIRRIARKINKAKNLRYVGWFLMAMPLILPMTLANAADVVVPTPTLTIVSAAEGLQSLTPNIVETATTKTLTIEVATTSPYLEAKKAEEAAAAAAKKKQAEEAAARLVASVPASGAELMSAVGIPQDQWGYVDHIIGKESGWKVSVYNRQGSGAYGICQAKPASKMASAGADWRTNPVTQLKWCNGYAHSRYGGWKQAYNFWQAHRWW